MPYNNYTDEDREQAGELLEQGLSAAEISRRLDIPERTVRQWRADWNLQPQRSSDRPKPGQALRTADVAPESSGKLKPWKIALAIIAALIAPPLAVAMIRRFR